MRTKKQKIIAAIISVVALIGAFIIHQWNEQEKRSLSDIPLYSDSAYVAVNGNHPSFTEDQLVTEAYEYYSELDTLGRCGYAMACVGIETMPTEERGSIGQVKPSGWHTVKYDFVDGKYLYNRCHLIGYQLTGENANERNLITGTRYLNIEGMLPFENMIADYVKETQNHVVYRVTPVFQNDERLARGVQLEAYSVEDQGAGICFNVYAYNVQPGVVIDYATGESAVSEMDAEAVTTNGTTGTTLYILNLNSMKFHNENCGNANEISEKNRQERSVDRETLIAEGFTPAQCCEP